jgi:hypothetical protein
LREGWQEKNEDLQKKQFVELLLTLKETWRVFSAKSSSHGKNMWTFSWRQEKLHGCLAYKSCRKRVAKFFLMPKKTW